MNILHVVDFISQRTGGGAARVPRYLAKEQAKLGHTVSIFSSDFNATLEDGPPGVELRLFKSFANGYRITPSMLKADFSKFDIIHLYNYRTTINLMASWQAHWHHIPYVLQALGSARPIPVPNHWYTLPWKTINDAIWQGMLLRANHLIACSDTEIDQYVAEGADRSKCTVFPMGLDLDDYSDIPARRDMGVHKIILYVGRFHELKGPDVLVRAFSQLDIPDARLIMVGTDDGALDETKRLVDKLGLAGRVDFPGFVDGRAKRQLYADADVYVLPSRYEAYGLCIQEALACGTPVIVTDRCAIADQIPDYCGQVVKCDAQAIADALRIELTREDLPILRNTRMKWARQFGWDKIARQAIEIYREVLHC